MTKIAIIGRPNVGKSTLFNKLCGRRLAITHDLPGVTRDVKINKAKIGKLQFDLLDTAGLDFTNDELTQKMSDHSLSAAKEADIILFMVDGRAGLVEEDRVFAKLVRKFGKPVVVIVNKAETQTVKSNTDFYKLGFNYLTFISAEHNLGFRELEVEINEILPSLPQPHKEEESQSNAIRVAIIGRPNAGKSTLFNKLAGMERSIVSPIAGTTRDAISHCITFKKELIELIDTAGLRRKSKIDEEVETLSTVESINALRRANLTALVIDGTMPLESQDLTILRVAVKEGKPVILLINKCDLIKDRKLYESDIRRYIDEKLFELQGMFVIFISALKDDDFRKIWGAILKIQSIQSQKIPTNKLNSWLSFATEKHIPPLSKNGRRIRLKYITQTAVRPQTFSVFGNIIEEIPESYSRYLYNDLRNSFNLGGVPIRMKFKKIDNPYEKRKSKKN